MTDSESAANDPNRSERLIELFEQARQLPREQRGVFLAEACGQDEALRGELESLLEHSDTALPTSAAKLAARQLADNERQDFTGRKINQYRLLGVLGEGGMGKVYLAEDERLARRVALKFLPGSFLAHAPQRLRFEQEARAASALNHPNIITVHEIGQHEETVYIAYELVEGQTLRQLLRDSKPSWQETVAIGAQIADALKAAHNAGIIHRDIKPENVMLRADGLVKVLDFGIAKRFNLPNSEVSGGAMANQANATQAGLVLGTPGYLSPEQTRGEKEIDDRTDIFSLGLVMYEMLAEHPYAALSPQEKIEAASSSEEIPSIGARRNDIPSALNAIVTSATQKSRDERFSSAREMLDALNELRPPTQTRLEQRAQMLAQKRANQLLNQAVALYASDKKVRLSPAALWAIWRHSTVKCGRLELALLRHSLFSVLGKVGLIALLAGLVTIVFAAWNSVEEKWDEQVLRDGHSKAARRAAFSPDGKLLATAGDDGKLIIWDFARRQQLSTIATPNTLPSALAFSPDGQWLAHSDKQAVVIRDAKNPQKIIETLRDHQGLVATLSFSPDGKLLASGAMSEDRAVLWSVEGWRKLRDLPGAYCGPGLLFYADSCQLIVNDRIFDLASGQSRMIGQNSAKALSPDNRLIIHLDIRSSTTFFDLARRRMIKSERAHQFFGRAAAFSHDGRLAVTGAEDIALWDVATHRVIARMEHSDNVWDLLFSPDDRWLVSTHGDGSILIWDMERRKRVADLAGHSDKVTSVAFSPSGRLIASASADQSVNLWDAASGLKEMALTGYPAALNSVSFWDEDTVLANDFDGKLTLRSITPQKKTPAILPSAFAEGHCLTSPDKHWLVCDSTVYDLWAQREVFDLRTISDDGIASAAFSTDSRWFVFSTQQRLFLSEAGSWCVVEQSNLSGLQPIRLAFTPDSQQLIAGCSNGEVALWQTKPLRLKKVLGKHSRVVVMFILSNLA